MQLPETWIRRRMGVAGLRTWRELQGVACIAFEQLQPPKQRITVSRSFPKEVYLLDELARIVSEFASMCAEKLRRQHSICGEVQTYIYTNRHREDQPQRYETGLMTIAEPTNSTIEIVRHARAAFRQIYRTGYGYKKAGVVLSDIRPMTGTQGSLFSTADHAKQNRLMEVFDQVNKEHGRGKIILAAQGTRPFKMNREHLSPRYTTDWKELLIVKTK